MSFLNNLKYLRVLNSVYLVLGAIANSVSVKYAGT